MRLTIHPSSTIHGSPNGRPAFQSKSSLWDGPGYAGRGFLTDDANQQFRGDGTVGAGDSADGGTGSWRRLLRVFTEPERRSSGERRRGRDPLRCEDWSEGKRQTIRRASDRE
jgi:hypothetical protein